MYHSREAEPGKVLASTDLYDSVGRIVDWLPLRN